MESTLSDNAIARMICTSWHDYRTLTTQAAALGGPINEVAFYQFVIRELPIGHSARQRFSEYCSFYKQLYHDKCTNAGVSPTMRNLQSDYQRYCVYQYISVLMEKGDIRYNEKMEWVIFNDTMDPELFSVYTERYPS